jgi:hypothetical protein
MKIILQKGRRPCLADCSLQQPQGRHPQLIWLLYQNMSWMRTLQPVFFVRSLEPFFCPCCQSKERQVVGSRNRNLIRSCGRKITLRIRRLRCKFCEILHHELPIEVIPYKRHEASSIEAVLEEREPLDTPADESTLKRWQIWFDGLKFHLLGALTSAVMKSSEKTEQAPITGDALQRIRQIVGSSAGWLGRLVQTIVKSHLWVQTRSAFHAG